MLKIAGKRKKDEISLEDKALLLEMFAAKSELDNIRRKYEYVTEPEMVASCIYQMHSVQERYRYLLGCVREKGLSLENSRSFIWKEL